MPETMAAILYVRGGHLYAVAVDGLETVRLTKTRAGEWNPAVSFDGRKIAFTRQRLGGGIWTMNADGTRATRVTRAHVDGSPAWAPDGRTLFFVRSYVIKTSATCGSIYRVATNGSRVRLVVTSRNDHSYQDPAVSPDGKRIAFSDWNACEGGTSSPRLRVVTTAGRPTADLKRLAHNGYYPDPEHASAAWSPDGSQLAFMNRGRLNIANRDGSAEHQIADVATDEYSPPAWSPDGKWIAFESHGEEGFPSYLSIVHPDGSELHRVTETTGDYSALAWLPSLPGP